MFSMSATAMAASSGMWRMTAGISLRPAICAARPRRSPALISYRWGSPFTRGSHRRLERTHDNRLHYALRLDGVGELAQRLRAHVHAWLIAASLQEVER